MEVLTGVFLHDHSHPARGRKPSCLWLRLGVGSAGYRCRGIARCHHHDRWKTTSSPRTEFRRGEPDVAACLVLDVELPDINGLDLQGQIAGGDHPPIVFITGHGDISSSVRAIKHGALDFLTKPFSDADVMGAIHAAIVKDREIRSERADLAALKQHYLELTPREREVLPLVVSGLLNKQAAAELMISEVTLQIIEGTSCRKWRRLRSRIWCGSLRDWAYR